MNPHLRPAADADLPFLYSLHATTMRELIEQVWGWKEEWQRKDFDARDERCRVSVIEENARAVGAIMGRRTTATRATYSGCVLTTMAWASGYANSAPKGVVRLFHTTLTVTWCVDQAHTDSIAVDLAY
jgi:hypothetical protein